MVVASKPRRRQAQEKKIKTKGIYSSTKYSLRDATINYAYKVTPKNTKNSTHIETGIESTQGKLIGKTK